MPEKLIDNIFTYDSYRYVPENLKLEWKTLYNYYSVDYFNKQHKIYEIYPQNRIDIYNEEVTRLNRVIDMTINFKERIKTLQPKYNIDINYSNRMKSELSSSVDKMLEFLNIKLNLINKITDSNNISLTSIKENYENDKEDLSDNKTNLFLVIILIYILFILLLSNN